MKKFKKTMPIFPTEITVCIWKVDELNNDIGKLNSNKKYLFNEYHRAKAFAIWSWNYAMYFRENDYWLDSFIHESYHIINWIASDLWLIIHWESDEVWAYMQEWIYKTFHKQIEKYVEEQKTLLNNTKKWQKKKN